MNLISIIVPVYNVEKYLHNCIDSILSQSYKNLELILVDDGSNDKSGKICDEYVKDKRVRVIHKENGGAASARNVGLEIATGDLIGFVDSDDFISPYMYEIMEYYITKYSVDAVSCTNVIHKDELLTLISKIDSFKYRMISNNVLKYVLEYDGYAFWKRLFRRQALIGKRFDETDVNEDIKMTYDVFSSIDSMIKIECPLYYWNLQPASLTRSPLKNVSNPCWYMKENAEKNRLMDVIPVINARIVQFDYRTITRAVRFGFYNDIVLADFEEKKTGMIDLIKKQLLFLHNYSFFRKTDLLMLYLIVTNYKMFCYTYKFINYIKKVGKTNI